jgi:3'(2'), 5'-bisphosphate nucleotidase
MNIETEQYINKLNDLNPEIEFVSRGSSLKFCTMAEGLADEYPRFGPTMEWDTAAGHAIATFAGCTIVNSLNNETLVYNKPDLLNPFFIVKR